MCFSRTSTWQLHELRIVTAWKFGYHASKFVAVLCKSTLVIAIKLEKWHVTTSMCLKNRASTTSLSMLLVVERHSRNIRNCSRTTPFIMRKRNGSLGGCVTFLRFWWKLG